MSSSPMCIKCGDYIHHGPIVCEPCFFNVETRHKSEMDVQAHRLREINAELLAACKGLVDDLRDLLGPLDTNPDDPLDAVPSIRAALAAIAKAEQ